MSKLKERSVVEVVILSLVTLGIYQLYWMYETNNELRESKRDVAPIKWFLIPIAVLIGLVIMAAISLLIGGIIGESTVGQIFIGFGAVLFFLMYVLFLPAYFAMYGYWVYWLYKFSKALEVESKKH